MENIDIEKVYDNFEKGFNGRMNLTDLPEIQRKVTFPHPSKPGEKTSQNYIEYEDLAVVVFIRKSKENGIEYGLIEKEAPAFISEVEDDNSKNPTSVKGYYGMFLEAPSFALPEKNKVPEDMHYWLEEQILKMGMEMEAFTTLDDSKTAILQSFANQNARFYVVGIKEGEKDRENKIHWFPISTLESYLDIQRNGGRDNLHSSIQTLYPLELLRNKFKEEIQKMDKKEFELDRELPKLELIKKEKTNPSYRFSIWEAYYRNTANPEEIKLATYSTSRSNAANCVLMTKNEEYMFLSAQQRSPYMEIDEQIKTEVAGGLTEGRTYDQTALAELSEEQGFEADSAKVHTAPLAATPLNSELSQAYIAYYEQGKDVLQHLDEQESIGKKRAILFESLLKNIKNSKIPLTTKYYVMLKARDKEKNLSYKKDEVKNDGIEGER